MVTACGSSLTVRCPWLSSRSATSVAGNPTALTVVVTTPWVFTGAAYLSPEIEYDKIDHTRGMDITFVTTAETNEAAKALMDAIGFLFKKKLNSLKSRELVIGKKDFEWLRNR